MQSSLDKETMDSSSTDNYSTSQVDALAAAGGQPVPLADKDIEKGNSPTDHPRIQPPAADDVLSDWDGPDDPHNPQNWVSDSWAHPS